MTGGYKRFRKAYIRFSNSLIFSIRKTKIQDKWQTKPSIPKGTRDFGPDEMAKRNYIIPILSNVSMALYGFQQIETPSMETLHYYDG